MKEALQHIIENPSLNFDMANLNGKNAKMAAGGFVIIENIHLVCLLDLTADFGVKTNAKKLTLNFQLREREQNWYSELSVHSNPDSNFCVNFLMYIL